jgi:leucyl aminopeptidase (aminopeptidase T)
VPVFMDTHRFKDEMPSDEEIRKAHAADVSVQERHGVNYMKYWVSNEAKVVHCLVEAPDAETAKRVHAEATGLMPDEIYEVDERS